MCNDAMTRFGCQTLKPTIGLLYSVGGSWARGSRSHAA